VQRAGDTMTIRRVLIAGGADFIATHVTAVLRGALVERRVQPLRSASSTSAYGAHRVTQPSSMVEELA
jgi:hypothetical protein